jgi:tetratricopeptide (TPR) repeat protein
LEQTISRDSTRPTVQRLAALDLLREKVPEFESKAGVLLDGLKSEHITKSRVRVAAEQTPDPNPRVQRELLKQIDEWKPDAAALWPAAWKILKNPESPPERIALALEAAREAALEPDARHSQTTLGAALYRSGDFAGALETLVKSRELWERDGKIAPPIVTALMAMANFKLGRIDEAQESIKELRALLSDPTKLKAVADHRWPEDDTKALLAEAEALIDPKTSESELPKVDKLDKREGDSPGSP